MAYVALGAAQGGGSGAAAVPIELVRVEHLRRARRRLRVAPEMCVGGSLGKSMRGGSQRHVCLEQLRG